MLQPKPHMEVTDPSQLYAAAKHARQYNAVFDGYISSRLQRCRYRFDDFVHANRSAQRLYECKHMVQDAAAGGTLRDRPHGGLNFL